MGKSYSGVKWLLFQHFTIPVFPKDFQFTQHLLFYQSKSWERGDNSGVKIGLHPNGRHAKPKQSIGIWKLGILWDSKLDFCACSFSFFLLFFFEQPESSAQQLMKRGGRGPIHTNHLILKIKNGTQTFKQTHCKSREMEIHGPSSSHMSGRLKPRRGPPDFHD